MRAIRQEIRQVEEEIWHREDNPLRNAPHTAADLAGDNFWFQLYPPRAWPATKWLLGRAERAGCPVVVLTVDLPGFGSQDRLRRFRGPGTLFPTRDNPECTSCHGTHVLWKIGRAMRAWASSG